jgi:hypothetical protein
LQLDAGQFTCFRRLHHGQREAESKKQDAHINRSLLEDVGRLRAPNLVRDAGAKSRAKTFLLRALHEHQQDEEQTHRNERDGHEDNEDVQ